MTELWFFWQCWPWGQQSKINCILFSYLINKIKFLDVGLDTINLAISYVIFCLHRWAGEGLGLALWKSHWNNAIDANLVFRPIIGQILEIKDKDKRSGMDSNPGLPTRTCASEICTTWAYYMHIYRVCSNSGQCNAKVYIQINNFLFLYFQKLPGKLLWKWCIEISFLSHCVINFDLAMGIWWLAKLSPTDDTWRILSANPLATNEIKNINWGYT